MSAFLGYFYSANLTNDEEQEIDQRTKQSRERFAKGFLKGSTALLAVCSLYLLTTYRADASVSASQMTPTAKSKPVVVSTIVGEGDVYLGIAFAFVLGTIAILIRPDLVRRRPNN